MLASRQFRLLTSRTPFPKPDIRSGRGALTFVREKKSALDRVAEIGSGGSQLTRQPRMIVAKAKAHRYLRNGHACATCLIEAEQISVPTDC